MDASKGTSRACPQPKNGGYESPFNSPMNSASLSGSEFALRVALCDLVERLKRSEQTCKYLEQCRNELAKEVIRLRNENHTISRENSMNSAIVQNEMLLRNKLSAMEQNSARKQQAEAEAKEKESSDAKGRQALSQLDLLKNSTETDESWEEITVRLLKQLREEMKPPQTLSADAQKRSKPTLPQASSRPKQSSTSKVACEPLPSDYETQIKEIAISEPVIDTPSEHYLSLQVQEARCAMKSVIKVTGANITSDEGALNTKDQSSKERDNIDFCCKVLNSLTSDISMIGQHLSAQNEKLTKLKNKQLRSYFRRQLKDTDHAGFGNGPKVHLEHV